MDIPRIYRGETKNLTLNMVDSGGNSADVSTATDVRASLARSMDSAPYFTKTGEDEDALLISGSSLSIKMTAEESAGLPLGMVYVQVWVQIDDKWAACAPVQYEVLRGIGAPT